MRRGLVVATALSAVAVVHVIPAGALPPPLPYVTTGACAVQGFEAFAAPVTFVGPGAANAGMVLNLTCVGLAPVGGTWSLAGIGGGGNCTTESGSASFSGTANSGGAAASLNWVRVGVYMLLTGTVATPGGGAAVEAHLIWGSSVDCATSGAYGGSFAGPALMAGS